MYQLQRKRRSWRNWQPVDIGNSIIELWVLASLNDDVCPGHYEYRIVAR